MEDSEDNMSAEEIKVDNTPCTKIKPKKRSLVERELETNLTARVTSPLTNIDATSTSRYGRARRLKSDAEFYDTEKILLKYHKSPKQNKSPNKLPSPVYKMHASNSPIRVETPKRDLSLDNQIETFYKENISLSRFGSEEKNSKSATKKTPKVYVSKDLIQSKDKHDDCVVLIKNMFSPSISTNKVNTREHSSEKYNVKKPSNGYMNTCSVVKMLDFDGKKKKKDEKKTGLTKSELFELEANSAFQVGDMAWARMGTYPFWPCIITRDPLSGTFVKKKPFGRLEKNYYHVTFCGDNGRRSWIIASMLRNFFGLLEFETARTNFTTLAKKRDPRLYAAFFVSDKKLSQWQLSVEEAEMLLREPKRLRIDMLNDILRKVKEIKTTPKHETSKKVVRTDSDVSLSESLLDTLFSEDDSKIHDSERSRSKSRNRSLDVSEVVTACLDNMAAKTGITKIQRQSHMDRWLQKAKSKTPEKSHLKSQFTFTTEKNNKLSSAKLKKKPNKSPHNPAPYSFRKFAIESQNENKLKSHQNEHDYSQKFCESNSSDILDNIEIEFQNAEMLTSDDVEPGSGLGVISKVETLCGIEQIQNQNQNNVIMTILRDNVILSDVNSKNVSDINNCNPIKINTDERISNQQHSLEVDSELLLETIPICNDKLEIIDSEHQIEAINVTALETSMQIVEDIEKDANELSILTLNRNDKKTNSMLQMEDLESCEKVADEEAVENVNTQVCNFNKKSLSNSVGQICYTDEAPTIEQNVTLIVENSIKNFEVDEYDYSQHVDYSIDHQNSSLIELNKLTYVSLNTDVNINNLNSVVEQVVQSTCVMNDNSAKYENKLANGFKDSKTSHISTLSLETTENQDFVTNRDVNFANSIPIVSTSIEDGNKCAINELYIENETQNHMLEDNNSASDSIIIDSKNKLASKSRLSLSLKKSCESSNIFENCNAIVTVPHINLGDNSKQIVNGLYNNDKSNEIFTKNTNEKIKLVSIVELDVADSEIFIQNEELEDNAFDNVNITDETIEKSFKKDTFSRADLLHRESEFSMESVKSIQDYVANDSLDSIAVAPGFTKNIDKPLAPNLSQIEVNRRCHINLDIDKENIVTKTKTHETVKIEEDNFVKLKTDKMSVCYDSENTILKNKLDVLELPCDSKQALKNSEFVKYLELKQDSLLDEQPELSQMEITNYLYKTWLYEESLKSDIRKTDDIQNARLVNGLKKSPIKIKLSLNKSSKRNKKVYQVQITDGTNESDQNPSFSTFEKCETSRNDCVTKRIKRKQSETSIDNNLMCNINTLTTNQSEEIEKSYYCDDNIKVTKKDNANNELLASKSSLQNGYKDETNKGAFKNFDHLDTINVSEPVTYNKYHEANTTAKRQLFNDNFDAHASFSDEDSEIHEAHQSQLTIPQNQSAYVADGVTKTKMTKERTVNKYDSEDYEEEDDEDNDEDKTSIESEGSDISTNVKKSKNKLSSCKAKALMEPEFTKYLELKQDALIDENPDLTEDDIKTYLYKTWLYEESLKNDIKKADNIETVTSLVKGLNQDPAPIKKARKKNKNEKDYKDCKSNAGDIVSNEKSKRKVIRPFYKEDYSDVDEDFIYFDIFKPKSKIRSPISNTTHTNNIENFNEFQEQVSEGGVLNTETELEFDYEEINEVEEYFRLLTVPKPNLFRGLIRERICEICEKVGNLIKCKGCHCMFHVDCLKKETKIVEVTTPVRGRKKKKKNRGRKAKEYPNCIDSELPSDDRCHDLNVSDETQNTSIENEPEFNIVANADDFEAQLSVKMRELLESGNSADYEAYSSSDEHDWNDIDYGQCKVVNVLPRKKDGADSIDYSDIKCNNCQKYNTPICFVCKSPVSPKNKMVHRQKCQVPHCHKYYHLECLDHWPQTQFNAGELSRISKNSSELFEAFSCPRHVCHTCVCDDPRGCKTRFSGDKLARCIRCPATYHTFTKCLPAGSQILTASHIICPRHYEHRPGKVPCHVNTGWCFICALGGTLICCEYCPTSFHAECLNIKPPEGGYMCEDCETGRLPLYGEMVWVKLGHYRWWPGMILHPSEVPLNIRAVKHSPGEFVVRFFGQYDHYWVNRGRVFPFQEGDSGKVSSQKSKIDAAFTMAMEHAQRACEILKTASPNEEESLDIASSLLPPHYVKLKVNKPCGSLCGRKVDIEESSLTQCECNPNELDPCGPYTQCLNRMLLTECGPTCRAGDRCNNRAFEKRLYPKMVPYRTPHRGWGLKALENIRAGQFVIEYVGELIDEEEFQRRMRRKHEVRDENFYFLTLDKERMIDAGPKGNLARFMNHSCEPNCETQKWTVLGDVRVGLFAIYDIPANTELTFNYKLESTGIEKKQCMCGAKRCSGYIGAKPKQDDQPKKNKPALQTKRTYKKRKLIEISPTKPKQRVGRPYKPRELSEIEKDLLIIKNATNGMSSDSECSRMSIDSRESRGLKRRRIEDTSLSAKKIKVEKNGVDCV